jgi:hypothetical protein
MLQGQSLSLFHSKKGDGVGKSFLLRRHYIRQMEQINRELKSDLGLGEHQVSGEEDRIEKSFGIAVMAYLFLIRACHEEIIPGQSWSVPQLQHAFRLRVITNQVAHNVKTKLAKSRKAA